MTVWRSRASRWAWAGTVGVLVAAAQPAWGAPVPQAAADAQMGPRDYTQRAANKLRPGSLLRSEGAEVRTVLVDLRGAWGKQQDAEVATHYTRMAEMDVIAELSLKHHDVAVAERVETVRRSETERFFVAMQQIRMRAAPAPTEGDKEAVPSVRAKPPRGPIYRQAGDAARQRLDQDSARTRLDELDLEIQREKGIDA